MEPFWTGNEHVFGMRRARNGDDMLLLVNFSGSEQRVDGFGALGPYGWVWR